jgi:hypothetical protein
MDAIVAQDAMGYPKLIDTQEAVHCFSDDDIMTMGARAQAYAFYDPRGPIAIVATDLESIEHMRRFMNFAAGDRPIRLFVAVEEARAWLGPNDLTGIQTACGRCRAAPGSRAPSR